MGVDFNGCSNGSGKSAFCLLALGSKTTHGSCVASHIFLVLSLEVFRSVVNQSVVEVFSAQVSITSSCHNLENTLIDGQKTNIEGSPSKVEDEDVLLFLVGLVKTVSNGCGGGFVNDTKNVEFSDSASVFGCLPLGVVEIRWNGNNSIFHRFTNISFCGFLHFGKNHRRNFFWKELALFSLEFNFNDGTSSTSRFNVKWPEFHICFHNWVVELASNEPFCVKNCVFWVSRTLIFCGLSNESLGIRKTDVTRGGSFTHVVCNDIDALISPNADTRVSCS